MSHAYRRAVCVFSVCIALMGLGFALSLGDVAREQRQKQQAKKDQPAPKVITNEEIPENPQDNTATSSEGDKEPSSSMGSKSAEQWKAEIAAQRNSVENLQRQIDQLNSSIHFAPGTCVRGCVQHNERQVEKQDEVQRMQAQLDEQKKRLDNMQEAARKEGFGNSVYEP